MCISALFYWGAVKVEVVMRLCAYALGVTFTVDQNANFLI